MEGVVIKTLLLEEGEEGSQTGLGFFVLSKIPNVLLSDFRSPKMYPVRGAVSLLNDSGGGVRSPEGVSLLLSSTSRLLQNWSVYIFAQSTLLFFLSSSALVVNSPTSR